MKYWWSVPLSDVWVAISWNKPIMTFAWRIGFSLGWIGFDIITICTRNGRTFPITSRPRLWSVSRDPPACYRWYTWCMKRKASREGEWIQHHVYPLKKENKVDASCYYSVAGLYLWYQHLDSSIKVMVRSLSAPPKLWNSLLSHGFLLTDGIYCFLFCHGPYLVSLYVFIVTHFVLSIYHLFPVFDV